MLCLGDRPSSLLPPVCLFRLLISPQISAISQGKEEWRCDYCQTCTGCGKGNEDERKKGGSPLVCVERGKVHHAHLDKVEGSDPGPRAHEKVRERERGERGRGARLEAGSSRGACEPLRWAELRYSGVLMSFGGVCEVAL